MNATEIEITHLFTDESPFVPFDCSNNRATLGEDAGALTWGASVECAKEITLLDSEERKQAFRDWVRSSGGWNDEEIAAWSDVELNALLLQWIAGDVREAFGDADFSEWDWADYQERSERGSVSSNLFRADDGRVFFSISH
jgi:hypothetical protein